MAIATQDPPERPIVIVNSATGESFEFDPPDDLWLDMLAYAEVTGLTIGELIQKALHEFLPPAPERS